MASFRAAIGAASAAVLFFGAAEKGYAAQSCALSLVLAMDVSTSVDTREFALQRDGLAAALTSPEVMQAIVDVGGIQAMAYEWSGRQNQYDMVPWTLLGDEASIFSFAAGLRSHQRQGIEFPTAIGYALGYGAVQLDNAPNRCARKVIDVSGDGVNNEGFEPRSAYQAFNFADVQVNGLVIAGGQPDPVAYYQRYVRHGTGAFIEVADGFDDYERAMKRKLLREIFGSALSLHVEDNGAAAASAVRPQ